MKKIIYCVNAGSVSVFINKIATNLIRTGYTSMRNCQTVDKPLPPLSNCHPALVALNGNLVKSPVKYWHLLVSGKFLEQRQRLQDEWGTRNLDKVSAVQYMDAYIIAVPICLFVWSFNCEQFQAQLPFKKAQRVDKTNGRDGCYHCISAVSLT